MWEFDDPDLAQFEEMANLLKTRYEAIKMIQLNILLNDDARKRLRKNVLLEYNALIVAEAQKIVDSYNPDGTPKENHNENH